ncbi:MAG: hypothetical protein ACI8QZ_002125 [Chlamydiales bacterium]|jgi:hypothetical protein
MNLTCRTALALALSSSIAMGQLIDLTAQDRYVVASADESGGGQMTDMDSAPDFGHYVAQVNANTFGGGGGGMSAASQDSQILADSFLASCIQSSSGSAGSESVASIEFNVSVKVNFEVSSNYNSSDGGFFSYQLEDSSGQYISAWFGIAEGPQSINHVGQLDPGSYSIEFKSSGGGGYSFASADSVFQLSTLSGAYCVAGANSAGSGASLALGGSPSIADDNFRLEASGVVPNVFGLAFYGPTQIQVPFGDGFRCIGGQTYRVQPPVQANAGGNLSKQIRFTSGPASSGGSLIQPQSTWNFQLWYRDPMGPGGTGYNTSDALWVTFCP